MPGSIAHSVDTCTMSHQKSSATVDRCLPVQPKPSLLVGNIPTLTAKGYLAPSMAALAEEYDYDVVRLEVGDRTIYVTADPEVAERVTSDTESFGKITHTATRGPFYSTRQVVGKALFTASDTEQEWGMAHRILISAFSLQGMKPVVSIAADATNNTLDQLSAFSPHDPVEIGQLMTGITFDVIGRFAAGMDLGASRDPHAKDNHPFLRSMEDVLETSTAVANSPLMSKLDLSMMKTRKASIKEMNSYVDRIIADRKAGKTTSDGTDLLSVMLSKTDPETGKMLPEELIRQQLITFFVAGHDSTSSLLTTVIFYLTQNPAVEAKMVAEIESVLGSAEAPSYVDLKKLKYTTMVMQEALRHNPPASGIQKTALKDTQLGPYFVKKGTMIFNSALAMHKNPKLWGADAERFDPENFSPEAVETRHKYAWLPFSAGPRACIGMQLSLTEAKVALAIILRRHTFRLHPSSEVETDFSKIFAKYKSFYVTVHPRSNSKSC